MTYFDVHGSSCNCSEPPCQCECVECKNGNYSNELVPLNEDNRNDHVHYPLRLNSFQTNYTIM